MHVLPFRTVPLGPLHLTCMLVAHAMMLPAARTAHAQCNGTWTQRPSAGFRLFSPVLAYDSDRAVTVLVDFDTALTQPFEWDGSSWTQRTSQPQPLRRTHLALAYDSLRHVTLMFGGFTRGPDGEGLNDTWQWDGDNWQQLFPDTSPSPRHFHAMAYDSIRGRTVLFGGFSGMMYNNDTWEWDGQNWIQQFPVNSPTARDQHAMTFDSTRGVTVLFGGWDGSGNLDDTWEWDGAHWTQRFPDADHRPPARSEHA